MLFHKFPNPANFSYPGSLNPETRTFKHKENEYQVHLSTLGKGIQRLTVEGGPWKQNFSQTEFFPEKIAAEKGDRMSTVFTEDPFHLVWEDNTGNARLQTVPGQAFGIAGEKFIMRFKLTGREQFYGMGEKYLGLELSNVRTQFWNTDAAGDFPHESFVNAEVDPAYVSIPWLIIRSETGWSGILVNNPSRVFIDTGSRSQIEGLMEVSSGAPCLSIGASHGQPDLLFLFADTLPGLVRQFQHLVGTAPLPPVWALGYHQCRWGYRSAEDLIQLKDRFEKEQIPVDSFWLDIDYMRGFRVFTLDENHFPSPKEQLAHIQANGQKVIPILDPGIKIDPEWDVFLEGKKNNVFCRNQAEGLFQGQVWPGNTAFVDHPLPHASDWWSDQVEAFAQVGFEGCWNDMNDPSVGYVDYEDMLWNGGQDPHWTYHNQFANGMVAATRKGFLKQSPNQRPFLLSRSGSTGIGRLAAIWHGDSCSNDIWFQTVIPTALNLSLSGVPFNGPDLGGFALDTPPRLFEDYHKACFLFPFCRNHTAMGTVNQEPWAFGEDVLKRVRQFIRTRYFLRPYLYQLFIQQEEKGDPPMRPLFYEFPGIEDNNPSRMEDQFMIGSTFLQAPLVESSRSRDVLLPPGQWWDFMNNQWIEGGRILTVNPTPENTPFYGRSGYAFVTTPELPQNHLWNPHRMALHLLLDPNSNETVEGEVVVDDGTTFSYREGVRSRFHYTAVRKKKDLVVSITCIESGFGIVEFDLITYSSFSRIILNEKVISTEPFQYVLAGGKQTTFRAENVLKKA